MRTLTGLASTYVAPARPEDSDMAPEAMSRYRRAAARLRWSEHHRRCVGLLGSAGRVLASADLFDLDATVNGRPIRCRGVGNIRATGPDAGRHAAELLAQAVDDAEAAGFEGVAVSSRECYWPLSESFTAMRTGTVTLHVTESARRGAPMVPVRSGERGDMEHLASITPLGSASVRLTRDAELLEYAITCHRLRAALATPGTRQVHFLVVEEGARAAAYVVVTVTPEGWHLEECGDRDGSGARVGALLQTLIAREAAERRPRIRASLPPGFLPPQVSVTDTVPDALPLWVRLLGARSPETMAGTTLAWWPGDPPAGF